MPAHFVVILEGHASRTSAMRRALARHLPELNLAIFDTAPEARRFFDHHLAQTVLISLDHDLLWPAPASAGRAIDPGTGRDVVDHLTAFPCVCPVIVHSANASAARSMLARLRHAHWPCSLVTPGEDDRWIDDAWVDEIDVYRARGLLFW